MNKRVEKVVEWIDSTNSLKWSVIPTMKLLLKC